MNLLRTLKGRLAITAVFVLPAVVLAFSTARSNMSGRVVIKEETLPAKIGEWSGSLEPLSDTEKNILQTPQASQRIYANPKTGDVVQVLLIQVENTQNAHDPRLCMAGSGYEETMTREEPAPWADAHTERNRVSHSIFTKDGESLHMYYWMATTEGTVPNMSTGLKWEGFVKALSGEPTRGIAIRVLGRPNDYHPAESPSPQVLQALWVRIREEVGLEELLRRQ